MGIGSFLLNTSFITAGSICLTRVACALDNLKPPLKAHIHAIADVAAAIAFRIMFNPDFKEQTEYTTLMAIALSLAVRSVVIYCCEEKGKDGQKNVSKIRTKVVATAAYQVAVAMLFAMVIQNVLAKQ